MEKNNDSRVSIIAAVAKDGGIGRNNKLLFWLPNDLKRFKQLTTGHTILMGRRTFESLPNGTLPNRRNMVLTRSNLQFEGAEVYQSIESALSTCAQQDEIFVIGGAEVYRQALPFATRLCLTDVDACVADADAFFPTFDKADWEEEWSEEHQADERHAYSYRFVNYIRKPRH